MSIKITCLNCGHKQELKSWFADKLGYGTNCYECKGSFNISPETAKSVLVPNGTKVKLKDGRIGIIDGNDFEDSNSLENVNYYFCDDRFTHKEVWSNNYEMLLRRGFELLHDIS